MAQSRNSFLTQTAGMAISLLDQGLFSINNFLLNIFLARVVLASEYGQFSVIFSVFLFVAGVQNALIIEPMSVIGPVKYRLLHRSYLRALVWINFALTGSFSVLILLGLLFFNLHALSGLLVSMAIATPFLLSFWFIRRFCYMIGKPKNALVGTTIYITVFLSTLAIMITKNILTGQSAFYLMGGAGLLAFIPTIWLIGRKINLNETELKINLLELLNSHWDYSKWASGTAVVSWLNSIVIIPSTAIFLGYSAAGVFRALQNFFLPVQQFLYAMANLLLPSFSMNFAKKEERTLRRKTKEQLLINLFIAAMYSLIVYLFRLSLIRFVFPGSGFEDYSWLFVFFGLAMLVEAIINVFSIFIKSAQHPEAIFYAQTGGAIGMVTLGVWLIIRFNLVGAGLSFLLTTIINLIIILLFSRKVIKKDKPGQ